MGSPILKMAHNPGGHWHPVRGPHPIFRSIVFGLKKTWGVSQNSAQPNSLAAKSWWTLFRGETFIDLAKL